MKISLCEIVREPTKGRVSTTKRLMGRLRELVNKRADITSDEEAADGEKEKKRKVMMLKKKEDDLGE